ncbi:MAG: hypothetical protein Q7N50_02870 [Armatimonadota bacterium]|nr:hypothetical protein [Armatimonadota bacterium]
MSTFTGGDVNYRYLPGGAQTPEYARTAGISEQEAQNRLYGVGSEITPWAGPTNDPNYRSGAFAKLGDLSTIAPTNIQTDKGMDFWTWAGLLAAGLGGGALAAGAAGAAAGGGAGFGAYDAGAYGAYGGLDATGGILAGGTAGGGTGFGVGDAATVDAFGGPLASPGVGQGPLASLQNALQQAGMSPTQASSLAQAFGSGSLPPGSTSAISRLLSGDASPSDYAQLAGTVGSTALGYLESERKADALSGVSDKYLALGAPYRGKLAASYAPGFSMEKEPGYTNAIDQTMNSYLRKASTGGNPFMNPGVSMEANKYVTAGTALPALQNYRSQLGSFGQLGTNVAGTADLSGANNAGSGYGALGFGLGELTQPTTSTLEQLLKKYVGSGGREFASYEPNFAFA